MKPRILIADDDAPIRNVLQEILRDDYDIEMAEDGEVVLQKIEQSYFDLLLLDLRMPRKSGMQVIQHMKERGLKTKIIVITADRDTDTAYESVEMGLFDYVTKPFDTHKLRILIKNATEHGTLEQQLEQLRSEVSQKYNFNNIIGNSKKMQQVFNVMNQVISTDVTVLITGESGSGKEMIAKSIHYNSKRRSNPFIEVDCAAIPENLMENELFGHEKGSFTGAVARAEGKFELADKGTLFLDEIGDLPLDLQAKLLRVLQEREFTRIGGKEKLSVDVRIIAATNANLKDMVEKGTFRSDLYYRINVIPIMLPALRDRPEDIPLLCRHFQDKYNEELEKRVTIPPEILVRLQEYHWPGNVRELENVIQRLVVLSVDGEVLPSYLPPEILAYNNEDQHLPLGLSLDELEKRYILQTLGLNDWNISKSSTSLGISRKTLHNKLGQYGIDTKKEKQRVRS